MSNITLEIVFGGLLALVQPDNKEGVLVIAPSHDHKMGHHLRLEVDAGIGSLEKSIPNLDGYELSILKDNNMEFDLEKMEIAEAVEVDVPLRNGLRIRKTAMLLDSRRLSGAYARKGCLLPAGSEKISNKVAFRVRLRSGKIGLSPTENDDTRFRAMTFRLNREVKIDKKRFVSEVVYTKTEIDSKYFVLALKPLRGTGDTIKVIARPSRDGKVRLRISNESDPHVFCEKRMDATRMMHSLATFRLLKPFGMPTVKLNYRHEGDAYPTLSEACEVFKKNECEIIIFAKEPAICYVVRLPAKEIDWGTRFEEAPLEH